MLISWTRYRPLIVLQLYAWLMFAKWYYVLIVHQHIILPNFIRVFTVGVLKFRNCFFTAVDPKDGGSLPCHTAVAFKHSLSSPDNAFLFSALSYIAANCVRFCFLWDSDLLDYSWELFFHPDNMMKVRKVSHRFEESTLLGFRLWAY